MFDVGHLLNNVLSTMSYERRAKERKIKKCIYDVPNLERMVFRKTSRKSNREVLLRDMACRNHIQS